MIVVVVVVVITTNTTIINIIYLIKTNIYILIKLGNDTGLQKSYQCSEKIHMLYTNRN